MSDIDITITPSADVAGRLDVYVADPATNFDITLDAVPYEGCEIDVTSTSGDLEVTITGSLVGGELDFAVNNVNSTTGESGSCTFMVTKN